MKIQNLIPSALLLFSLASAAQNKNNIPIKIKEDSINTKEEIYSNELSVRKKYRLEELYKLDSNIAKTIATNFPNAEEIRIRKRKKNISTRFYSSENLVFATFKKNGTLKDAQIIYAQTNTPGNIKNFIMQTMGDYKIINCTQLLFPQDDEYDVIISRNGQYKKLHIVNEVIISINEMKIDSIEYWGANRMRSF